MPGTSDITEERLNSPDDFRIQIRHRNRKDKLAYATKYGWISDTFGTDITDLIKDVGIEPVMAMVDKVFAILMAANAQYKTSYRMWKKSHVPSARLLEEINKAQGDEQSVL